MGNEGGLEGVRGFCRLKVAFHSHEGLSNSLEFSSQEAQVEKDFDDSQWGVMRDETPVG
jgi:hypothetical protein